MASSYVCRTFARRSLLRARNAQNKFADGPRRCLSSAARLQARPVFQSGGGSSSSSLANASRVGTAAASAITSFIVACRLIDNQNNKLTPAKDPSGPNASATPMQYYEPGTVEEMQHSLVEYFVSKGFGWSNGWLLVEEAHEALADALKSDKSPTLGDMDSFGVEVNRDFPSLEITLLNNNCPGDFQLNSPEPIPIENDFFIGNILLNVQPQSSENSRLDFSARQRFEIQLQGRFKRNPEGTLYCGAELADKDFRFNKLMRGVGNFLIKLLSQYIGPNMAYSFGGKSSSGIYELSHIAFPLKTAMQHVIVTPAGATPPRMGEPFVKETGSKSLREVSTDTDDWDTECTYSMSFSSSCLDLPTWRVVDPYDTSLSLFWGDSPLRLVIYEKGDTREGHVETVQDANNYLLALQIKFLGLSPDSRKIVIQQEKEQFKGGGNRYGVN